MMFSHKIVNLAISIIIYISLSASNSLAQSACQNFLSSTEQTKEKPHFFVPDKIADPELTDLHNKAAELLKLMPYSYSVMLKNNPNLNAVQVYELSTVQVNILAESLKKLSQSIPKNSPQKRFRPILYSAYLNLFTPLEKIKETRKHLYEKFSYKTLFARKAELTKFSDPALNNFMRSSLYKHKGYLAEYMTPFYVHDTLSTGLHVDKIITPSMKLMLDRTFQQKIWEHMLSLEIDIVFNNGASWGEVKNRFQTFTGDNFEKVYKRALEIKKMLDTFSQFGVDIKFHFFFYNGGVTKKQKKILEDLGMIVE